MSIVTHIINTPDQPVPVEVVRESGNLLLNWEGILTGSSDWVYSNISTAKSFSHLKVLVNYPVMCLVKLQWRIGEKWVDGDVFQVSGSFIKTLPVETNEFRVGVLVWSGTFNLDKTFKMEIRGVNNG